MRWWLSLLVAGVILAGSVLLPGRPDTSGPSALGQQPASARLMDYRSATGLIGIQPNPDRSPTAQVWVVTVDQPQEYTAILDASGAVINTCMGCPAPAP